MSSSIVNAELVPQNSSNDRMPVTRQDLDSLSEKRSLLREFVSSQLVQGTESDGDYAVIAGCKKPSLLKPGAEKLKQLFGLGSRTTLTFKELDHNGNFAMFVYKCEVFNLKTGIVICECEGSANSKEKKWATRSEWVKSGGSSVKTMVETPIYDVLNTLMKMAQKRAEVGAIVNATGASDFFTHDMDSDADAEQVGVKATVKDETKGTQSQIKISGNTVPHKEEIKKLGGKWDQNNKVWIISNPSAETVELMKSLDGIEVK